MTESYEELEFKVKALEERIAKLENELNSVVDEVRTVLVDVRSTISELDNPLNYIKELGLSSLIESAIEEKLEKIIDDKLKEIRKEVKEKISQVKTLKQPEEKKEEKKHTKPSQLELSPYGIDLKLNKSLERLVRESSTSIDKILSMLTCAGCLVYIFGKRGVERVLDEYAKRGWITHDLKLTLLQISSLLELDGLPDEKETGIEDHLIVMYLLDKLHRGAPLTDFIVLLLLLSKYAGFPFILRVIEREQKPR